MQSLLAELQDNCSSLWAPRHVQRIDPPTAEEFYRQYVATNTPVIIRGLLGKWADAAHWSDAALMEKAGELTVTVDVTPGGHGDCCAEADGEELCRVPYLSVNDRQRCCSVERLPAAVHDRGLGLGLGLESQSGLGLHPTVVRVLSCDTRNFNFTIGAKTIAPEAHVYKPPRTLHPKKHNCSRAFSFDGVPYLSHQNSSLTREFAPLAQRVPSCLPLARDTFRNEPEAVNLWVGDGRAVSACHKDHFENLYCVLRGEKRFTLLPPTDILFLYQRQCRAARYAHTPRSWKVQLEDERVPWISADPAEPNFNRFPLLRYASPVQCAVGPGETLYLPAMWYHRVAQKGVTVAVNYWHDMAFDHKFVYHNFLVGLAPHLPALLSQQQQQQQPLLQGGHAEAATAAASREECTESAAESEAES
ncbi:cupin-like domain-containing protein [Tribonema minus]|uniref:Cupin-like domain-containing protein n=1 Tax=Tribonema minus TaxID=303371 RepID=A0A836CM99_9STRA|nr:cupin-like domain-containing protein [Tribonema minus]